MNRFLLLPVYVLAIHLIAHSLISPAANAEVNSCELSSLQLPASLPLPSTTKLIFPNTPAAFDFGDDKIKGWNYLRDRLVDEGISSNYANWILADSRMPKRQDIFFKLKPRESKHMYRRHNTKRARENALHFYRANYRYFNEAELLYGVPAELILAILQVETQCGGYTGQSRIFHRLARLTSAGSPENISANHKWLRKSNRKVAIEDVQDRAEILERMFLPHLVATIELAEELDMHPLEIRGSVAGAIGLSQFLPGNIKQYGQDGNGDRVVDLYTPADAIYSVANYMLVHGWTPHTSLPYDHRYSVVWEYNHSDSYVTTVLALASDLQSEMTGVEEVLENNFEQIAMCSLN